MIPDARELLLEARQMLSAAVNAFERNDAIDWDTLVTTINDINAFLAAPESVMVPLEPTETMLKAADKALWKQVHSSEPGARNDRPICIAVYKAMLAARGSP